MTPEQIDIILEQNAALLKQNQQLISMLQGGLPGGIDAPLPKPIRKSRKAQTAEGLTAWCIQLSKKLNPTMAAQLKATLQKKKLWQAN